jgi:hypothetical protein
MSRNSRSKAVRAMTVAVIAGFFLAGCRGRPEQPPVAQYISPSETLSLPQLIAALNDRSEKIESLHLQGGGEAESGGFEARIHEGRDRPERFFNGEITAMYLAPNRLRLIGGKDLAGRVFDLGTDGERFWMHLPTENQLIYGSFEGLDPERASQFPIRPDLVLEVLGVAPMETDLTKAPVPMLRWNPDPQAKAYMLTWAEPVEGPPARWRIVKEVWYDFDTLLPTLVVLFDADGDPVVRAYLSNHRPIGDEPDAPMIASYYDLYFPETGTRMWLDFGELRFSHRRFPRESSFTPPNPGDVPDAQNLDAPSALPRD